MKILICGKGGSGKSTPTALMMDNLFGRPLGTPPPVASAVCQRLADEPAPALPGAGPSPFAS